MVGVVISYCSNDKCFIKPLIDQCKIFADEVVVVSCSHYFDGHIDNNLEDLTHLGVNHYIFDYLPDNDIKYHHNWARYKGLELSHSEFVLFLDADEIPDGNLMYNYLREAELKYNSVINFKCHWYFREPIYRARRNEICGLLAHRSLLTENLFFTPLERWSYKLYNIPSIENADYNGLVIMHHFSWVKTKFQMLKKVSSWGHHNDKNWEELIEKEFDSEFSNRDFVHGYTFERVVNQFNIELTD